MTSAGGRARGGQPQGPQPIPAGGGGAVWPSRFSSLPGHSRPCPCAAGAFGTGPSALGDFLPEQHTDPSRTGPAGTAVGLEWGGTARFWLQPSSMPSVFLPSLPSPLSQMPTKPRLPCWLLAGFSGLQEHLVGRQKQTSTQPATTLRMNQVAQLGRAGGTLTGVGRFWWPRGAQRDWSCRLLGQVEGGGATAEGRGRTMWGLALEGWGVGAVIRSSGSGLRSI